MCFPQILASGSKISSTVPITFSPLSNSVHVPFPLFSFPHPEITIFRTTTFGLLVTAYFFGPSFSRGILYHHSSCHQFNNIALVGGFVLGRELAEYGEQLD
jgi:hypothetical protein